MNIIMKRFASRRVDRAQTRSIGFMSAIGHPAPWDVTRDTSARLYKIDQLSFGVMGRSIAVEEAGRVVIVAS